MKTTSDDGSIRWQTRHAWLSGVDLSVELLQAEQEGRDLTSVRTRLRGLQKIPPGAGRDASWLMRYARFAAAVPTLPMRKGYTYDEPGEGGTIRLACATAKIDVPVWRGSAKRFEKNVHGALLGRMCGCLLGKPVAEWYRTSIEVTGKATGNWPISRYLRVPTKKMAARIDQLKPVQKLDCTDPAIKRNPMLLPRISGMVEDDNMTHTVRGHLVIKNYGATFTSQDVATTWLESLPVLQTTTAVRAAYRNLLAGIVPPASAVRLNPYREWCGAKSRADIYGYMNPGRPERAAEWAWRDAIVSHTGNGVYGAMWVAAMLAVAAVLDEWEAVIRAGLDQVPERCRLREDVEMILALWEGGADYGIACEYIHAQWNERRSHDWHHVNANAQVIAAALLWGDDAFGQSVAQAVMCGFDTAGNGATVGSLWGVMHGAVRIPETWAKPIRNTLCTGVVGYHEVAVDRLAEQIAASALAVRE